MTVRPDPTLPAADDHRAGHAASIWLPWILGSALVVIFIIRDLLLTDGTIIDHSVVWGRDFINVWTGGQLIRDGQLVVLYDPVAYSAYQRGLFGDIDPHNYSYPPVSFPAAVVLSCLPYPVALATWLLATGALFVAVARRWWPLPMHSRWLAAFTPAALVNIWAGHYGFVIGALFLLGWQHVDRRPLLAGVFFGLMLIKPHLAVLVPVVLLVRGDWRAIAAAAATAALLVLTTTVVFGWTPWADYLLRTLGTQAAMIDAGGKFFSNLSTSMTTALLEAGATRSVAVAGQGLSLILGVGLVVVAAWRRMPTASLALLTATCTFLVLPYAFTYDLTVVALGALVIMVRTGLSGLDRRLAILGFIVPQLGIAAALFGLPFTPFVLIGLAVAQIRVFSRRAAPTGAAAARSA